ncbi:MAG: fasciclin domain-containing protein [Proteobacteria bacterium]|nr:fasciclin domain-containing protein [Pseudomonadota bacterium]MBW3616490.1 fasciclin domain-containing protein [Pseudomonadota bacterium]
MNEDAAAGSMGAEASMSGGSMNSGSMGASGSGSVTVAGAPMYANRNIVQNAQNSPIHRTLVAAVVQAQLADTLSGPGPFTVFAPTDTAFNAVPASARNSLMQDANRAQLQKVLTYHVVPGRLTAADLMARVRAGNGTANLTTVEGSRLMVHMSGNGLTVMDESGGTARVTQGDVMQSNGVIHVVDKVLMPR